MEEREKRKSDYLYKIERVCGNGSFAIVFQVNNYIITIIKF
jgi:hypothetical protein